MIRVEEQDDPPTFAAKVKQPGELFLAANPHATAEDLDRHPYWRRAAGDLYNAYGEFARTLVTKSRATRVGQPWSTLFQNPRSTA